MANNTVLVSAEEPAEPPPEGSQPGSFPQDIERFALSVMDYLGISGWELSIFFCSDPYIESLNAAYRKKDEPTDVLSFVCGEEFIDAGGARKTAAGDIVISMERAKKNCVEFGVEPEEEIKRLIVHGILHLAGYDHEDTIGTGDGAPGENLSPMLKLQEEILQKLHIKGIVEDDNGFI